VTVRTDTVVIGAGWAGLAAAVELTRAGIQTTLLDAAPQPGGRARQAPIRLAGKSLLFDNGQHLLIGAYRESLRLAQTLHLETRKSSQKARLFERHRLSLRAADGLAMDTWPLPAPLNLLAGLICARKISIAERAMIASLMLRLSLARWKVDTEETVSAMLRRLGQSAPLCERFWNPLVIGSMNTMPEDACANTFARVLADSLGSRAQDSDFVLPSGTLGDFIPGPANEWLRAQGARVKLRTPVRELSHQGDLWCAHTDGEPILAKRLVLAVPAYQAARLLEPHTVSNQLPDSLIQALKRFEYDSIATAYLAWPAQEITTLPRWLMLTEEPGAPGQWLFDRGEHQGLRIAAVVVSACSRHKDLSTQALGAAIGTQISRQLDVKLPMDVKVLIDKRATLRCTVSRPRIGADAVISSMKNSGNAPATPWASIVLAGDYAYPDYPATLEAAVRSGNNAAALLIQQCAEENPVSA
jgi:squalene-associated FAD-dependent desaturase